MPTASETCAREHHLLYTIYIQSPLQQAFCSLREFLANVFLELLVGFLGANIAPTYPVHFLKWFWDVKRRCGGVCSFLTDNKAKREGSNGNPDFTSMLKVGALTSTFAH